MQPTSRVNAVVVAFNRPHGLIALVNSLRAQTRALQRIIVIDNSTDDAVRVAIQGEAGGDLTYVRMPENTGSAGGFERGLRESVQDGDHTWLFDDDMVVDVHALEELLRAVPPSGSDRAPGVLRSWYRGSAMGTVPWRIPDFAWRGTMISSAVVRGVGYPDARFFLYSDDVEYALRIAKGGFIMLCVPASIMMVNVQPTRREVCIAGVPVSYNDSPLRLYYSVRNEIVLCIRNRLGVRLVRVMVHTVKIAIAVLIAHGAGRGEFLGAIGAGFVDGVRGRLGRHWRY